MARQVAERKDVQVILDEQEIVIVKDGKQIALSADDARWLQIAGLTVCLHEIHGTKPPRKRSLPIQIDGQLEMPEAALSG